MYLNPHVTVQTPPAELPVTLDECKAQMRITDTSEDALIEDAIEAVTDELDGRDGWLGRALITQTLRLTIDHFPCTSRIYLPCPPLQSVSAVNYLDLSGAEQVLPAARYRVVTEADVGYIDLLPEQTWPDVRDVGAAVWVNYVAGYGTTGAAVPSDIKRYMRARVATHDLIRSVGLIGEEMQVTPDMEGAIERRRVRLAAISDDRERPRWRRGR